MAVNLIKFLKGTQQQYNGIATKDENTLYFCTDTQRFFIGAKEITRPLTVGNSAPSDTNLSSNYPPYSLYFNNATLDGGILYYNDGSHWFQIYNLTEIADALNHRFDDQTSRNANTILAAPDGTAGTADFRQINSNYIFPIMTKTWTGIYETVEAAQAYYYFGEIRPDNYNKTWRMRYRVTAHFDSPSPGYGGIYDIWLTGIRGSFPATFAFNTIDSTSYRPIYTQYFRLLKEAGYNNNHGHLLGIRFQDSYQITTASRARTITIDILELENCSFSFYDNYTKASGISYCNDTNYNTATPVDATAQGLQETGDSNIYTYTQLTYNYLKVANNCALGQYSLFGYDRDGKVSSFATRTTTANGTDLTINRVYYSDHGFDWTKGISYSNSGTFYAASANANISPTNEHAGLDFRYSDNVFYSASVDSPLGLAIRQPVYWKGIIKEDGLFYLTPGTQAHPSNGNTYSKAWTQDIPTSAEIVTINGHDYQQVYWFIGYPYYNSTYTLRTYQINLYTENKIYWYHNGRFEEYSPASGKLEHTLTFGNGTYVFDGSADVTVPLYDGSYT